MINNMKFCRGTSTYVERIALYIILARRQQMTLLLNVFFFFFRLRFRMSGIIIQEFKFTKYRYKY